MRNLRCRLVFVARMRWVPTVAACAIPESVLFLHNAHSLKVENLGVSIPSGPKYRIPTAEGAGQLRIRSSLSAERTLSHVGLCRGIGSFLLHIGMNGGTLLALRGVLRVPDRRLRFRDRDGTGQKL